MRGFTLIEALIYTALFSFIIGGAILAVYSILDGSARTDTALTRDAEARFVLQKIAWALNSKTTLIAPADDSSGDSLSLVKTISGTPTTISININNGRVYLTRNAGPAVPLTSERISVDSLLFHNRASAAGAPRAIEVTIAINGTTYGPSLRYAR